MSSMMFTKQPGVIDLAKLHADGFDTFRADHYSTFNKVWEQIQIEEYVSESETKCARMAAWEGSDRQWGEPDHVPQIYRDFIQEMHDKGVFANYEKVHGKFTHYIYMLHHTAKGYVNPWHGHYLDGMHVHVLLHLGVPHRQISDGGKVELGKIETEVLNMNNYVNIGDEVTVKKTGEVACDHGDVTILMNANPYFVHQVTKVLTNRPRYTLMVACGYRDNTLNKTEIDNI